MLLEWADELLSKILDGLEWILVSENGLFLTLGSGTSSARNENLRPLLNTNIPLISGKCGPKKPLLTTGKSFSHE